MLKTVFAAKYIFLEYMKHYFLWLLRVLLLYTYIQLFNYFAKNASAQSFESVNLFLWNIYLPKLSKQTDLLE